jgi:hypothetical protein
VRDHNQARVLDVAQQVRYVVRSGTASDWMVWDRARHGPAICGDRLLAGVSREVAEAELRRLLSPSDAEATLGLHPWWRMTALGLSIDCALEDNARLLARRWIEKGAQVTAQLIHANGLVRSMERHQIRAWAAGGSRSPRANGSGGKRGVQC